MSKIRVIAALLAIGLLTGCTVPTTLERISPTPVPTATETPMPTETPVPTQPPAPTPFPTANEPAPERTFTHVGFVADLNGEHNVSGRVIVAGLQTLIIQGFNFDGKGSPPDLRLVLGDDYDDPAHVIAELEPRAYENEFLYFHIPSSVGPGSADSIAVYNKETGEVYAAAKFQ